MPGRTKYDVLFAGQTGFKLQEIIICTTGMFNKLANYIKETKIEMTHVAWPTKSQAVNFTILVVAFSVGVSLFLGVFDMLFGYLVQMLIG